jgi:hypothetical protein
VRLVYPENTFSSGNLIPGQCRSWQNTPWVRIFLGVLLSQGLYYGLRQLFSAGFLATGGDNPALVVWSTLSGILFIQVLQVLGLLAGGLLAGAGFRRGKYYGAMVGACNGILTVMVPSSSLSPTIVVLVGQPLLHTAFAALGGLIASQIWKAPPQVEVCARRGAVPVFLSANRFVSLLAGPVAWGRVAAGSVLTVSGTVSANYILQALLDLSKGTLSISSHVQSQLVTWEVTALAMFVGSALAGSCTLNSIKQGLGVGIVTSMVLVFLRLGTPHCPWLNLGHAVFSALIFGFVGGWFGGSLFPPLVSIPKKRGLGPEAA